MAKYKIYKNPLNEHTEKVKDGFNWLVFCFGPLWFITNGFATQGLFWLTVSYIVCLCTLGFGVPVVWIIAGWKANAQMEKKYLEKGWQFVGYQGEDDILISNVNNL